MVEFRVRGCTRAIEMLFSGGRARVALMLVVRKLEKPRPVYPQIALSGSQTERLYWPGKE